MKRSLWIMVAVGMVLSVGIKTRAATPELPDLLPDYYTSAFVIDGVNLNLFTHSTTNGVERWQYGTADQSLWLSVELIKCDSSQTKAVFNNLLGYLNAQAKEHGGSFTVVEKNDAYATITEEEVDRHYFVYKLPYGIQIWTYSILKNGIFPAGQFESVRFLVNRHRYSDAYKEGNVTMGKWGDEIYDYASVLLQTGEKKEAVTVLGRTIATSPYNYDAHLDFFENTDSPNAATNSARIIADNAEDEELVRQAEAFLGLESYSMESVPYLSPGERGLQLVMIPLPPCSVQLLEEVAVVYRNMTDMPVKICRLKEDWKWSSPERFGSQRAIERMLVSLKKEKVDFTGWTKEQYIEALREAGMDVGALYKYYIDDLVAKMDSEPGQYQAGQYVDKLCRMLEGYCSSDKRTMYVGVTEANIYSDNNNYLFSQGREKGKSRASVLSYHMMQASVLEEDYAFRPRLAERLAKEMVPASLKQLGIPRSTDPRCPYSYSSGVGRLTEKTLTLSPPVKEALQRFKEVP